MVIPLMDQYYGRLDYNEQKDERIMRKAVGLSPF